jgi:hypothetical protein
MTGASDFTQSGAIASWHQLLRDEAALLRQPGAHYKKLLDGAHALHRAELIDRDVLADLLEQADGALAYAVEALLNEPNGPSGDFSCTC